jgi:hypothetical protein
MLEHRFRELVTTPVLPAFVACPVFASFALAQQSFVTEVYRVAREMTAAQMRPAPRRLPAFSLN